MSENVPFSATVAKASGTLTFTHTDGKAVSILRGARGYDRAMALLKEINATEENSEEETKLREELYNLTVPASRIAKLQHGEITVESGKVMVHGKPVNNVLGSRILWMLDHDEDVTTIVRFYDNLVQNPSYRAVNELFRFMEDNQMGITRDGYLLAYKRVNEDFSSIYEGPDAEKIDNSPGQKPSMPRNEVDDNPVETCSKGLHVCSIKYLPSYRGCNNKDKIVICKIHPKDVVSVPLEHHNGKIRVCEYEVLREIHDDDGDILGLKPVWEPNAADVSSKVKPPVGTSFGMDDNDPETFVMDILYDWNDDIQVDDTLDELGTTSRERFFDRLADEISDITDISDFEIPEHLRSPTTSVQEIIDYVAPFLRGRQPIMDKMVDIAGHYHLDSFSLDENSKLDEFGRLQRQTFIADLNTEFGVELPDSLCSEDTTFEKIVDYLHAHSAPSTPVQQEQQQSNETAQAGGGEGALLKQRMEEAGYTPKENEAACPYAPQSVERDAGDLTAFEEAHRILTKLVGDQSGTVAEVKVNELPTAEYMQLRAEFDSKLIITPLRRIGGKTKADDRVVFTATRK